MSGAQRGSPSAACEPSAAPRRLHPPRGTAFPDNCPSVANVAQNDRVQHSTSLRNKGTFPSPPHLLSGLWHRPLSPRLFCGLCAMEQSLLAVAPASRCAPRFVEPQPPTATQALLPRLVGGGGGACNRACALPGPYRVGKGCDAGPGTVPVGAGGEGEGAGTRSGSKRARVRHRLGTLRWGVQYQVSIKVCARARAPSISGRPSQRSRLAGPRHRVPEGIHITAARPSTAGDNLTTEEHNR